MIAEASRYLTPRFPGCLRGAGTCFEVSAFCLLTYGSRARRHRRIGASAHRRIGASAHRRIGASAHRRIGASAHRREGRILFIWRVFI
ncbi:hypothetical protein [Ruegeria sp.]|uniref:hypothetical protein n=1 Tax=Ruegeria sp. TaxID=1879320 RepID=UPI003B00426F